MTVFSTFLRRENQEEKTEYEAAVVRLTNLEPGGAWASWKQFQESCPRNVLGLQTEASSHTDESLDDCSDQATEFSAPSQPPSPFPFSIEHTMVLY